MPLQKKLIDVPMMKGVSQKSDDRYQELGGAVQLINARKVKDNDFRKRFGNMRQFSGFLPTTTAGGSYKTNPIIFGQGTYPYLSMWSETAQRYDVLGFVSDVGLSDQVPVASFTGTIADVAIETGNGYTVVAYTGDGLGIGSNQLWTTVLDANGAVVWPAQPLTLTGPVRPQAQGVKLVTLGNVCVLVYMPNATTIAAVKMDLTQPWLGWSATATNLATDACAQNGGVASSVGVFDAQPVIGDATRFILAYAFAAGSGVNAKLITFNVALVAQVTKQGADVSGADMWSIAVYSKSGEQHWVAYQKGDKPGGGNPSVLAWTYADPAGAISNTVVVYTYPVAPTNAGKITIERNSATDVTVGWCPDVAPGPAAPANAWTRFRQLHVAAAVVTLVNTEVIVPGVLLGSKPVASTSAYVVLYVPSLQQGTQFLAVLDWWGQNVTTPGPMRIAATFAPRQWKGIPRAHAGGMGGGQPAISVSLPRLIVAPPGPTSGLMTAPIFESQAQSHQGLVLQTMSPTFASRFFSAEIGDELLFGSGCSMVFDGQEAVELGYAYYPESGPPVLTVGTLTGTFSWIFIWEWYDAHGNVHWSATSPAVTATLANQQSTFTLPALGLSTRGPNTNPTGQITAPVNAPVLVPYRTTNGGTIFYREVTDPAPSTMANSGTNFTGGQITWNDNISDATLTAAGTQLLYTTGGVLDNFCPPGKNICIAHKSRAWLAGGGQAFDLWPSQATAFTTGTMPGFNEALVFQCSGQIRGLASMDDKLFVFTQQGSRYGIEYITGDGPTNIGTQSDWTPPQQIPTGGVGAVDQRSIATTDQGVLFLSPIGGPNGKGGFFMLTRGLQVQYIGGAVEDTVAANPICTSAVVHPNAGYVYFWMVPSDPPTSGVRLCWDYIQGVWSLDNVADPDQVVASQGAKWAWNALGPNGLTYHWLTQFGVAYRETNGLGANSYLDAGTWVPMTYSSAWLKPSLSGFARFWRVQYIGDSFDPHNLTLTLTFDQAPASYYNEPTSWTAAQIGAFDRAPQEDFEVLVGNQKAKSIQITVTDAPPTGGPIAATGQGPNLAGFSLEIGVDGTRYPNLPARQRA